MPETATANQASVVEQVEDLHRKTEAVLAHVERSRAAWEAAIACARSITRALEEDDVGGAELAWQLGQTIGFITDQMDVDDGMVQFGPAVRDARNAVALAGLCVERTREESQNA